MASEKLRMLIQGGKGLLGAGYLAYPTLFPLALPHNGIGEEGTGEGATSASSVPPVPARRSYLHARWARHRQMGQFVIDHDGDLSALEVGRDEQGKVHSPPLARSRRSVVTQAR